jgi:hypothetical protein
MALMAGGALLLSYGIGSAGTTDTTTAREKSGRVNLPASAAVNQKGAVRQIVFEEQKIEGKIRRPQLVLIKADQRPEFGSMVMQSMGKTKNIAMLVDEKLIEEAYHKDAFQFKGTKIINISP